MSARNETVSFPAKVESAVTGGDGKVLTDPPTFVGGAGRGSSLDEPAAVPRPGAAAGLEATETARC